MTLSLTCSLGLSGPPQSITPFTGHVHGSAPEYTGRPAPTRVAESNDASPTDGCDTHHCSASDDAKSTTTPPSPPLFPLLRTRVGLPCCTATMLMTASDNSVVAMATAAAACHVDRSSDRRFRIMASLRLLHSRSRGRTLHRTTDQINSHNYSI